MPDDRTDDLAWKLGARIPAADYRVFTTAFVDGIHPRTGATKRFSLIEAVDWINVIAITAQQQVVLIRQFRVGTNEVCLEIPGGMVDPGEPPRASSPRRRAIRPRTGTRSAGSRRTRRS
jgi:ADP-ribose pyrophosphatase